MPFSFKKASDGGLAPRKENGMHPVDNAFKRTDEEFIARYLQPDPNWQTWAHPTTHEKHTLRFSSAPDLSTEDLEACYRMVEETSGKDYRNSTVGWHEKAKREEMRSEGLRYILVELNDEDADTDGQVEEDGKKDDGSAALRGKGRLRGFVSMMPTWENSCPVVYCYEIHTQPYLQGTGLAQLLMSFVTTTTQNISSAEKTMLTCFVANTRGRRFYEKLGFVVDESSPRDRVFRSGRVVRSDYVVLSKAREEE